MAARKHQSRLEISNRIRTELSANMKASAEEKSCAKKPSGGVPLNERPSPYIALEDRRGSKKIREEVGSSPSAISNLPSARTFTKPRTNTLTPQVEAKNMACTFIDSVTSLCSKSFASCGVTGEADEDESIFLNLISLCGVEEARFWCQIFGFKYERCYAALAGLFYGVPNHANVV